MKVYLLDEREKAFLGGDDVVGGSRNPTENGRP